MLYDKRWDRQVETKPDQLSLQGLIAWLEQQPAERTYDFSNCRGECLIDLYVASTGRQNNADNYIKMSGLTGGGRVACDGAWTFGAALSRAKALLKDTPRTRPHSGRAG